MRGELGSELPPRKSEKLVALPVGILVHPDHSGTYTEPAIALVRALSDTNVAAEAGTATAEDIPNHDTIHIVVGKKPL